METKPDSAASEELSAPLVRLGLLRQGEPAQFRPLTGGVASDIWLVKAGQRVFVVKRALARLNVAADWRAPVSRNGAEAAWLRQAARTVASAAPAILAEDREAGLFAMTYLPPDAYPVWKARLRQGDADLAFAGAVGRTLAQLHAAAVGADPSAFNPDAVFVALRLEPYLTFTAARHPDVAAALERLAQATLANKRTLVHGDVSPKNILVGPEGPVFLDAECAWYGDPAFDLAFCLNHLMLKAVWTPAAANGFAAAFQALRLAYLAGVSWEARAPLECRAARLLPGLLLARIDGKSPVEYITDEDDRAAIRGFAKHWLKSPSHDLGEIAAGWAKARGRAA
jgi:aminoglycoside phosphotransferase (APT) family kinase protein